MPKTKIYSDTIEQAALNQFDAAMALPCVIQGALMPDSHKGYSLPIGAVVKTRDRVFPGFVGYDIGCGVASIELAIHHTAVDLVKLREHILKTIPIGFNSHTSTKSSDLDFTGTSQLLQDLYSTKGVKQLGTLGGGNHFIEVGYLESNGNIAIVIHSGSRGFGHGVAAHYMREAASLSAESGWKTKRFEAGADFEASNSQWFEHATSYTNFDDRATALASYNTALDRYIAAQKSQYMKQHDIEGLHSFDIDSDLGKQYMIDQNFCLNYAVANRKAMLRAVTAGVLENIAPDDDIRIKRSINRNHNHAEQLPDGTIIHRKGATHAEKGMYGVVPGNMRDGSFIVKGKGNPDSMCSSSHGAGRVLSRTKARATLSLDEFRAETAKLVTNHTDDMLDEAPNAYKNIFEVMELQSDLVDVIDRVVPILNIKG
jgi:tRNA-splicing ligase RtcB